MDNNEMMNRRRFFKKTAKEILPMLGAFVAAPTVIINTLTSCDDNCDGCEAACQDNCVDSCKGACYESCSGSTMGGGCSDCSSSCSNSSTSSTCTNCANDCASSCKETCQTSCEGSATGKPTTGIIDGHEYVDLGLSVLWATQNIGASIPDEAGEEFAFVYPEKYKKKMSEGGTDWDKSFESLNLKSGQCISGTYLDTARNLWGGEWRMPTKDERDELRKNCTFELVAGVGVKIVSKTNGNSILMPFHNLGNDSGFYWTGDVGIYKDNYHNEEYLGAYIIHFYEYQGKGYDGYEDIRPIARKDFHQWTYISFYDYTVWEYPIRPVLERSKADVSTCNGTCTANCSSNCSSTCKNECSGTCKGSCGNDCTGGCKDGCSTGCYTTCKGECKEKCTKTCADSCSNNCTGKCTATCADSCKAQTSQYCSNCASNCSSGCTTTCADACKAQTSQGCSNCATQCSGDCNHECTYGCGRQCHVSCGGQCSGKCGGNCYVECVSYAKNTPCASCGGTCRSACNENCTYDCYSTCKSIGYK